MAKIETLTQGSIKLREREFHIIPEALKNAREAVTKAQAFCFPHQECSEVAAMEPDELDKMLDTIDPSNTQKEKLRQTKSNERADAWLNTVSDKKRTDTSICIAKQSNTLTITACSYLMSFLSNSETFYTLFEKPAKMLNSLTGVGH